jgi:hypothetical protein
MVFPIKYLEKIETVLGVAFSCILLKIDDSKAMSSKYDNLFRTLRAFKWNTENSYSSGPGFWWISLSRINNSKSIRVNIFRKDRNSFGGGVLVYTSQGIVWEKGTI